MPDPTAEQAWKAALAGCPDDILEAEIVRRMHEKKLAEIPQRLAYTVASFQTVEQYCQSYIDQLAEDEPYADDRIRQYVFEAAMEALYGKGVWEWIKKRLQ